MTHNESNDARIRMTAEIVAGIKPTATFTQRELLDEIDKNRLERPTYGGGQS